MDIGKSRVYSNKFDGFWVYIMEYYWNMTEEEFWRDYQTENFHIELLFQLNEDSKFKNWTKKLSIIERIIIRRFKIMNKNDNVSKNEKSKYGFGYKRTMNRLKNEILKLPTTPNGDIDWDFMEAQGRLAEEEVLKRKPAI